ncbi:hypothetical protein LMG31884_25470 [Xanthomonas hydrangeae]|uniref:hypothetical protein n=1 Tax=Xanthomonas hydrangeae TaxID=2775159 RepID=UPI001962C5AF|nr:hypothetical protein LMG31884_25470 [Xanthomonas hydrangeae]CAD7717314.1 hypothetical protein LMG31884_25470 [Xanthomonas hydrangeae]CAD7733853.1 hypothetical protein LMG31887_25350 [Xanthomonas hydrangeae]CAD7733856.1 hypothetical protein LMG31887_25350 [Xanthomonas hydrangeae]
MALKKLQSSDGIAALVGTPEQVRIQLSSLYKARKVVAFAIEEGTDSDNAALAQAMLHIAPLVKKVRDKQQKAMIDTLIETLVPRIEPSNRAILEAKMMAQVRQDAIEATDWLTAAQIAEVAELSQTNPSAQPNKWKRDGLIFAVQQEAGKDLFPRYALDSGNKYRPVKALAQVLKVFAGKKGPWGLASWFSARNSFLGGQRPQDLLTSDPQRVINAAQDEAAGVLHG